MVASSFLTTYCAASSPQFLCHVSLSPHRLHTPSSPQADTNRFLADAYLLNGTGSKWTRLSPAGNAPRPRALHAAVLIPPRGTADMEIVRDAELVRVCIFGGWTTSSTSPDASGSLQSGYAPRDSQVYLSDLHIITMAGDRQTSSQTGWSQILPLGPGPTPRAGAAGNLLL